MRPPARELEEIAIEAGLRGADVIRAAAGDLGEVRSKSTPTDPVTALDLAVEDAVRVVLERRTPSASFIGEERETVAGSSGVGWVIDPIDGTVNLTYGLPFTSVSVAATVDGTVVAGCVVDPYRRQVYSAHHGGGARHDGTPVTVSGADDLAASLISTGFDYTSAGRAAEAERLAQILPAARDIRCFGSAALNLAWVACGLLDGHYQRNMKLWDYAAGAHIAAEAGARIAEPSEANGQLMVVATPLVFEALERLAR